jgi:predicted peptidase
MITRRKAIQLVGKLTTAAVAASIRGRGSAMALPILPASEDDPMPPLAAGAPMSQKRRALIEAFEGKSAGLEQKYEGRAHKGEWTMPYRLFRPETGARVALIVYLHGSGGLGDDNLKQLGLGNIFGTRVWLLAENQLRFPCYVLVPQTDRGWVRYDPELLAKGEAKVVQGLGDGNRLALEIVDKLLEEFPMDHRRIYVTGQSMGGAGVWNITAHRKQFFAAAAPCCGGLSLDDPVQSAATPVWAFHGSADKTVPVSASRERIAALRKAGAHPLYTEYDGVDHNSWEWAYTEPALVEWVFAQQRR